MKKKVFLKLIFPLALILVLAAGIGTARAYFTTYVQARGGYTIRLGDETEISEGYSEGFKRVVIRSDADSEPVYVRVTAFCGDRYMLRYIDESGRWSKGANDDYYYYSDIVNGGGETTELKIEIGLRGGDDTFVPLKDAFAAGLVEKGDSFNVVVIYESTPVRYDGSGQPYADWNRKLDSERIEGNGEVTLNEN